jgi:hypothetical protein
MRHSVDEGLTPLQAILDNSCFVSAQALRSHFPELSAGRYLERHPCAAAFF